MSLRVLIIPDKFKGTLTAQGAAQAIADGWSRSRPRDALELLPMSDGGDGFGEVMSALLGATPATVDTCNAAHRSCAAKWWWHAKTKTAIIETARVIGLAMLPSGRYHPFQLDTYGLGKVIREAAAKLPKRIVVGVGGSATNDGGFGMARSLGWKFVNERDQAIEHWTELGAARQCFPPQDKLPGLHVVVAVDVQNPLLGPRGATRVYGPQKGLRPPDFSVAEQCLRRLAHLVQPAHRPNFSRIPGAGAAGGLGFGFAAFLKGRLEAGFELFAREVGLDQRLREVDLVLTGEGSLDRSTFMGKGAGQVARRCCQLGVPCIGLAGVAHASSGSKRSFAQIHSLTELTTIDQAKAHAARWLERLASQVAREI